MAQLDSIQNVFQASIFGEQPADTALGGLFADARLPGMEAFQIYRNNVRLTLKAALADNFPATKALVGDDFFAGIAGRFILAHPPGTQILANYGGEFPDFLAEQPELAALPYACDLARLEWHRIRAHLAKDVIPLTAESISQYGREDIPRLKLPLVPSCRFINSSYQIDEIWHYCSADQTTEVSAVPSVEPVTDGISFIIYKGPSGLAMPRVSAGTTTFMMALGLGRAIEDAFTAATRMEPGFDLGTTLGQFLAGGAFAAAILKDKETDHD